MKQGWEIRKLKELGITQTGTTPKTSEKENFGDHIPFIKPADVDFEGNGKLRYENEGLSEIGLSKSRKIERNSIFMVCIGATIGKVGFSEMDATCNQQINTLTLGNDYYPKFFYYGMTTKEFQDRVLLEGKGAQATLPIINKSKWENLTLPFPKSLPEQHRIVSILDEAFAAIAKAKANAEQNLKNAKELFESYLQGVFEKKGDGWEQLSVKECVENDIIYKPLDGNHGEIHPTKNDFVSSGVPFIMSRDMKNGGIDEIGCNFITEKQAKTLRTGFAKNGDVLLSHKGTIGGVSILKTEREFIVLTPQITYYRIKDNKKLTEEFLFYYFLNQNFQKEINSIAQGGSTRAYIGITKQLELNLVIAPLEEQQIIVRQLDALRVETQKLEAVYQKKIDDLEELKKSILQKAFAGELKTEKALAI